MNDVATTGLASESGHWYDRAGAPCYEVKGANGAMRPATLRDARKYGWVPGFSSIAKMEAKPQLTNWLIEQAYLAAMTLPRIEGEALESFMARCRADAGAQASLARDRGTELHAALESYYRGQEVASQNQPFVFPVVKWLSQRFPDVQWFPEKSFAHPLGFGGKLDLHCDQAVVDFKFKDFKETPKKTFAYPEHAMQLHAYAQGIGRPQAVKLNLFISSTVPGLIYPHTWVEDDSHWEAFRCLLRLWQLRKSYESGWA